MVQYNTKVTNNAMQCEMKILRNRQNNNTKRQEMCFEYVTQSQ